MKKKKDVMTLGGGVVIIAVLVAFLLVLLNQSAPQQAVDTATTTPQATTEEKPTTTKPAAAKPDTSVVGVAKGIAGASIFRELLQSTGVAASLTGGTYTVFVPSNTAFATVNLSEMTAAQKKRLVQYHVVAGKALDLDAISSGTHTALSKDTLNFNVNLSTMTAYVNSGKSSAQYKASNGVVYAISAVLVPPQFANPQTGSTGTPTPR